MNFSEFRQAVQIQFSKIQHLPLFRVDVPEEELWETYLGAFPPGTNPIYKTKTDHDCTCCRHFIRDVGGLVALDKGMVRSIWSINIDNPAYRAVAHAMASLVEYAPIKNVFLHPFFKVGTASTRTMELNGPLITWDHFTLTLPSTAVHANKDTIGAVLSNTQATHDVFKGGLEKITLEAIDTVLDLISQKSLYRGEEHLRNIEDFRILKVKHAAIVTAHNADLFCWEISATAPQIVTRIKNQAIGTLLVDLSEGRDLDEAVAAFERMVAPQNYKRTSSVVTQKMIDNAKETIQTLGYAEALHRRYARVRDITLPNLLFVDRSIKPQLKPDILDDLTPTAPRVRDFSKVGEMGIEDFIANVLPKINSLEVMVENRHRNNFVSLIAPQDVTAKGMFKWCNSFSWSYAGDFADSIKERVKKAGGKVDGDLRCSLSWFNHDDLDLHMVEPNGTHIYFGRRHNPTTRGTLDVDMNAGGGTTRIPVENICYPHRVTMREGVYQLQVNQYCRRESTDVGFEVEIEFDGTIHTFIYAKPVRDGETINVATINYSKKDGFKIVESLPSTQMSKEVWGLNTQAFHKVQACMLSPNYWDGHGVGNKHYFFMLEGCRNECTARGFYNEFLSQELNAHRKVLDMIGSRYKVEPDDNQLSGLGFSSTKPDFVLCRVKGSISREIKVTF